MRLFGDLVIAAFFEGSKPKERRARRDEYAGAVFAGEFECYRDSMEQRRREDPPFAPFHWEIEFPEVFDRGPSATSEHRTRAHRRSKGFDAIVGNPPFLGGKRISTNLGDGYRDWLADVHAGSSSNADLVAHFFRRAFDLLRSLGTFGLIATNTIAQGDTRASGLRWICTHGGEVFAVRRRVRWPGLAAVIVSVIHIGNGPVFARKRIDGRDVDCITAFLFHRGGHGDPVRLKANAGKSFQGSIVVGMGFTFDDTDTKGVASPLAELRRLIQKDPRNQEVVFPYIGGQEVNSSPTQAHHRYVIDFKDFPLLRVAPPSACGGSEHGDVLSAGDRAGGSAASWKGSTDERRRAWLRQGRVPHDYPGPVAADWPDLLAIVEERVKPERMKVKRQAHQLRWWQYGDKRPALYRAIAGQEEVLVISQVTQHVVFAHLPAGMVYSHRLYVLSDSRIVTFAVLQSRCHEVWARFFGSSLEDRFMYAAADCFETFPFPNGWDGDSTLQATGREYAKFRTGLMARNDEGLTQIYNRFHDPYENNPEIRQLRELHTAMDRRVLDAYGWGDISTNCDFYPDYEADEDERGNNPRYRYRWSEEVQADVRARLLELNVHRAG